MKTKKLLSLAAFAAFIVMAVASGSDEATKTDKEGSTTDQQKEKWEYSEKNDEMSGQTSYFAECQSTNTIKFEFPYNEKGGSSFALTVRNMDGANEVYLTVSKGQFMTNVMGSQYCRVKFDEGQSVNYKYNSAADGSSDILFLSNSAQFIKNLKAAKQLKIEAPFFQAGRQIIEFDVEGLVWDKK